MTLRCLLNPWRFNIRFQRLNGFTTRRYPLSGCEDFPVTRRCFSQTGKTLAGSHPKALLSD
ncbi:hypothetical protein EVD02_23440, partial [Salmonella enterica]|nr:hypothetical protein [Salmonella enterica]